MNGDSLSIPSLDRLHDILLPPAVSWWPPAATVWLIVAVAAAWLVVVGLRWRQQHRQDAYRRAAFRNLDDLQGALASVDTRSQALAQVAEVLKRAALAAFPRQRVAALSGEAWLRFLAATASDPALTGKAGRVLVSAVYDPRAVADLTPADCDDVLRLARNWIANHRLEQESPSRQAAKPARPEALPG